MDIKAEKIELMKLLLSTENPSIIESIKQIFKKENPTDFWKELTPEERLEINRAEKEISNGEITDYETFMSSNR